MEKETLVKVIQNLLAKTTDRGCTQAEAEAAIAKAEELMLKHNLRSEDIEAGEVLPENWISKVIWQGAGIEWQMPFVNDAIDLFFVRVIRNTGYRYAGVTLFGEEANVLAAEYIWVYLNRVFKQLWTEYRVRNGLSLNQSRAFYMGLLHGFKMRIEAERRKAAGQAGALVVVEAKIEQQMAVAHPDLEKGDKPAKIRGTEKVYQAGVAKGSQISIAKGVGTAAPQKRIG